MSTVIAAGVLAGIILVVLSKHLPTSLTRRRFQIGRSDVAVKEALAISGLVIVIAFGAAYALS